MKPPTRTYNKALLILLVSVVYAGVYIAPEFFTNYASIETAPEGFYTHQLITFSTSFLQLFALLFVLSVWRPVAFIMLPLIFLFTGVCDYMQHSMHQLINRDAVVAAIEASYAYIGNYMSGTITFIMVGGAIMGILVAWGITRYGRKTPNDSKAAALLSVFVVMGIMGEGEHYAPYHFLSTSFQYGVERVYRNFTQRFDISTIPAALDSGKEPPVVVMVMGESARADHLGMNGYKRDTTPLMGARKNVVSFTDAMACGVFTRIAAPCIMTRATRDNIRPIYEETSIVGVFRKLGFHTAWLSAQGWFSSADPTTIFVQEADKHIMLTDLGVFAYMVRDELLLPHYSKQLTEQNAPMFMVLHIMGSHWQYSARYSPEFAKFQPTCDVTMKQTTTVHDQAHEIETCQKETGGVVNAYDNSILYTDHILNEIITPLEKKNALVMYVSDHAESLGEEGRWMHGNVDAPEQWKVPFIVWVSDSFVAQHPEAWKALTAKKNAPVSQDYIFHSLLDCIGVKSDMVDPKLSLCK